MQKVELSKVLELLIAEDRDEAANMLHEWFVGKSKSILEELMQEDDSALDGIESDKDEIENEEYFGDADLTEAGDDEGEEAEEVGADEFPAEVDAEAEGDFDAEGDLEGEMEVEEVPVEDKVDDLEAQLASLKAEFDKLMGGDDVDGDEFGGEEVADDMADIGDDGEDFGGDVEESVMESEDEDEDQLDEDFQDLEESFELEKVADPKLNGESEIGTGAKVSVLKTSPIPQRKPEDRVGGAAVEIKSKNHKGYAREASPGVNTKPILKNQVNNAKQDLVPVKQPQGDASALLNKGPTPDKGKSPIGGGAVDLRGNDIKRKK